MSNNKIYNVRQASAYLKVSQSEVKRLVINGQLKNIEPDYTKQALIPRSELRKHKEKNYVEPRTAGITAAEAIDAAQSLSNQKGVPGPATQD